MRIFSQICAHFPLEHLLGQWLNFQLFGIIFSRGNKVQTFFFRVHWLSENICPYIYLYMALIMKDFLTRIIPLNTAVFSRSPGSDFLWGSFGFLDGSAASPCLFGYFLVKLARDLTRFPVPQMVVF